MSHAGEVWVLGVDASSIQDTNYRDFHAGDGLEFSVEFHFSSDPDRADEAEVRAVHLVGPWYELIARVVAVFDRVWVIDCGIQAHEVRAGLIAGFAVGDMIRGVAYLGLEGYGEYTEGPNELPGMPPLVYSWTIESLLMNTTPWVRTNGRGLGRDESRRSYEPIEQTNAWNDDEGRADYVLTCTRHAVEPTHQRGRPGRA